jgi:hypothetical protein
MIAISDPWQAGAVMVGEGDAPLRQYFSRLRTVRPLKKAISRKNGRFHQSPLGRNGLVRLWRIMAPSGGPLKQPICKEKPLGSTIRVLLGAAMGSSAWFGRTKRARAKYSHTLGVRRVGPVGELIILGW